MFRHGNIWNCTARISRLTQDPQRMLTRLKYLKQRLFITAKGMLWADDNVQLPNSYFSSIVLLNSLEKRLSRNTTLKENNAKTIDEDV